MKPITGIAGKILAVLTVVAIALFFISAIIFMALFIKNMVFP